MSDDEQNRFEVILEDINGKFGLVLEGHATLEHMIHEHRAETRQDKRELQALIQTSHDSLDAKINKVSTELKETRGELKETRGELKETRGELKETREEMAAGFKAVENKVDGHEERIVALERKAA